MPLRITKRHNSPNWYLRGTIRGITVDETTGTTSKEKADEIRIKRETDLLERSIHGEKETVTFLEAAVLYLEAGGSNRFIESICTKLGSKFLATIDQRTIDKVAVQLHPSAKAATLNRQVYTPISAVLNFAARRGLCEYRPMQRPKLPVGRIRYLKIDEANRLVDACSNHMRPLVVFMLYTGARVSEALYLNWDDVDLSRQHVAFLDTKNGESRGVSLHTRALAQLANLKHRKGNVFRRPDGLPYARRRNAGGQIKTGFRGACRRAGIENLRPHDLRHTWATWHYAANRDLPALMRLGGWKSERMVLRYAHVNVDELASTIEALPGGNLGSPVSQSKKVKGKQ